MDLTKNISESASNLKIMYTFISPHLHFSTYPMHSVCPSGTEFTIPTSNRSYGNKQTHRKQFVLAVSFFLVICCYCIHIVHNYIEKCCLLNVCITSLFPNRKQTSDHQVYFPFINLPVHKKNTFS